jgi:enoyl-CoA hydratase/carnithine racemase
MLEVSQEGPLLKIFLNRPQVHNAFNEELIAKLYDTFTNVPQKTRVILLAGKGPSFSAGGDLEWMKKCASYTFEENQKDAFKLAQLFESMVLCPAPILASVHGAAFGGGCGLVAASDIAVATREARFAFSEVKLGLVPATISPIVISKIGAGHARALFITGEVFDANHAFHIGLVHAVGDSKELDSLIDAKIRSILSAAPGAIAKAKKIALGPALSLEEASKLLAEARSSPEGKEGVAAFLEKRKAHFVIER